VSKMQASRTPAKQNSGGEKSPRAADKREAKGEIQNRYDEDFVNTPEERAHLQALIHLGVDITVPLEEQSVDAQAAYWEFAKAKAKGMKWLATES